MKKLLYILAVLLCPLISYGQDIVPNLPIASRISSLTSNAQRGEEFAKYLFSSVRVGTGDNWGSGTMCYFDGQDMYVISAGHLFGRRSFDIKSQKDVRIDVFYQNIKKLDKFKTYKGKLLCSVWSNNDFDVSLMKFKPDWENPDFSPIAISGSKLEVDKYYHSVGCDRAKETAHYLVQYEWERKRGNVTDIITRKNGPVGGRSGGGVLDDDGYLVAICSRGDGYRGMWSSTMQMHKFLNEQGFDKLLINRQDIPVIGK